jgi:hypothetical protein
MFISIAKCAENLNFVIAGKCNLLHTVKLEGNTTNIWVDLKHSPFMYQILFSRCYAFLQGMAEAFIHVVVIVFDSEKDTDLAQ